MIKLKEVLEIITKNTTEAIILLDDQGCIQYLNHSVENLLGYSTEELIGQNFFLKLTSQENQEENLALYQQIIEQDNIYIDALELNLFKKDGCEVVVEMRFSPSTFNDKVVCLLFMSDVTAKKEQESQNKEIQEIFQKITNTARDAIIMIDNEGLVSYWNPAAERMFGYTHDEVYNQDVHKLIAPKESYPFFQKGFTKFKYTGKGAAIDQTLELTGMRKDGSKINVELSVSALEINSSWNAIALIRDITDRKDVENNLTRVILNYENIFNSIKDKLYIVDKNRNLFDVDKYTQLINIKSQATRKCYKTIFNRNDICPWCKLDSVLSTGVPELNKLTDAHDDLQMIMYNTPIILDYDSCMLTVLINLNQL